MTIVDRVAIALATRRGWVWDRCNDSDKRMLRDTARAAIAALREPSEEMIQANICEWDFDTPDRASAVNGWRAAIAAALEEDQAVR